MRRLSKRLRQRGYIVFDDLDLVPNDGRVGIEVLARQLGQYINDRIGKDQSYHLIGFSMGGLIIRYFFQYLSSREKILSLVTIGTPHNGTYSAYFFKREGCLQMRPGSKFLNQLKEDSHLLKNTNFTSIWANYDLIILPPNSSCVPIGKEVVFKFGFHLLLPFSKKVLIAVEKAIES